MMRNTRLGQAFLARVLAGTAIATGMGVALAAPAHAQGDQVTLDVKAGPLSTALNDFAGQTGYQLLYPSDLVAGKTSPGASGAMSVSEGLSRILRGTGLGFRLTDGRTIQISAATTADGEKVTGAVQIEGAQGNPYFGGAGVAAGVNGINGSRDITATEGTGSFTSGALTIGSKVPQAIKDVPQSVSVLTNERIEQQNVTDLNSAMSQLPGVKLIQGSTSFYQQFYSRGFEIDSFQIDGGAPLGSVRFNFYPLIDMSVYDHVELVRGAAGLFNGYGDPSGVVNLVRKKPLDHSQYALEAQAGSWSNYRIVADATAPLALDGRLRGRLVMTYQDRHYFYDLAKDNKTLIYGIAELDLTPSTLISAGINYTRQQSRPWQNGLPRYQAGPDLELPRSTSLVFPWNRWDFDTTQLFGTIEQKLGGEWTLKLNLTHNRQESQRKLGYTQGSVNPVDNSGLTLTGFYNSYGSEQLSMEGTLTGAFQLFGQRQEIVAGINRVNSDGAGQVSYNSLITSSNSAPYQPYPGGPKYCTDTSICPSGLPSPGIDPFNFNPNDPIYSEPGNPLATNRSTANGQVQTGAYISVKLTAFDRLHLLTGLRWSRYESKYAYDSLCYFTTGQCAGKPSDYVWSSYGAYYHDEDFSWPPPVNLSFDVTKALTAYVGYTDIYQDQSTNLTVDLVPIGPVTGSNWEAGLKWAPRDGRLNVSIAAYRIDKKGFATRDGTFDWSTGDFIASNGQHFPNYGAIDDVHNCCFVSNPEQSQRSVGLDFEISGEVASGFQVSASANYNETTQQGTYYGDNAGKPYLSILPKFLYKLWMSYDFGAAGHAGALSGLTVSAGFNGQSSGYYEGTSCPTYYYSPYDYLPTLKECYGGEKEYTFTVAPYLVASALIDYRFSDHWSLGVNVENIFDKTYYQQVGTVTSGNWYGTPRSFTATLRAKW